MNEEIKVILDYLKDEENTRRIKCITIEESKQLLDYITNLQQAIKDTKDTADDMLFELKQENSKLTIALQNIQEDYDRRAKENERLKEENNNKAINDYAHAIDESWYRELYDDYKSRCEKASDKLSFIDEALENDTLNVPLCITKINSALNILQNGSEKDDK